MKQKIHLTLSILPSLLPIACNFSHAGNRANMYGQNQVATSSADPSMRTDVSNEAAGVGCMQLVARMDAENATWISISVESTKSEDQNHKKKYLF